MSTEGAFRGGNSGALVIFRSTYMKLSGESKGFGSSMSSFDFSLRMTVIPTSKICLFVLSTIITLLYCAVMLHLI